MKIEEKITVKTIVHDTTPSAQNSLTRLMARISDSAEHGLRLRIKNYRRWAIAASIALLLSIGGGTYLISHQNTTKMLVTTNMAPKAMPITLPDGSQVILNVGTKLIYPETFKRKCREVFLVGEGSFDVAHNTHVPFIVRAGDIEIKVLGTKFNVKAYANSQHITTTLVTGSVEITNDLTAERVTIHPNQQVTYNQASGNMAVTDVDDARLSMLWQQGVWHLDKITLSELCKELERIYNLTIRITNPALLEERFTGDIFLSDSLNNFLEVLQITSHITYEYQDDVLIIK